MTTKVRSVLYVRLPCWKIYPGGVIYVADYIHKQRPEIDQHCSTWRWSRPVTAAGFWKSASAASAPTWWRSRGATCSRSGRTRGRRARRGDELRPLAEAVAPDHGHARRSAHHLRLRRQPAAQLQLHAAGGRLLPESRIVVAARGVDLRPVRGRQGAKNTVVVVGEARTRCCRSSMASRIRSRVLLPRPQRPGDAPCARGDFDSPT